MSGENNISSKSPVTLDDDVEMGACCCTCTLKSEEERWGCFPYKDCYVISAQIVSIAALCISCIWWVMFLPSIVTTVFLQVLWCRRPKRCGMIASVAFSGVTAVLCLLMGCWFNAEGDFYGMDPYLVVLVRLAGFVDAALWLTVCGCLWYFVASGRQAKFEAGLGNRRKAPPATAPAKGHVTQPL
eukprot:CAMPEP_0172366820 /NCGR_PEP_ID=MMETSP1060-20121228/17403_1 /TAXON_ID=37318 /ORGANISM="Pseudo-nitzschia pungens, Strain cf. cingulata" /LENGTH=184 /DNA_ID=CAMNT_0013090827 /DNA_START=100 /DNA_END=654 /DNA_ORIENTATION=-